MRIEFSVCSFVPFGIFSTCVVFFIIFREFVYSFNKQFWHVQWVSGIKRMR